MWMVTDNRPKGIHVYPAWESEHHDLEDEFCVCEPECEFFDNGEVVIHHVLMN
jgi:hypothetical protein